MGIPPMCIHISFALSLLLLRLLIISLSSWSVVVVAVDHPKRSNYNNVRQTQTSSSSRNTDGLYNKCGFSSNTRFRTWFQTLYTNSPVLFPTNDEELINIVNTARNNNCKVRVRGHGHSEDGVVMQKQDDLINDVIIISLRYYIPNDPLWHKNIIDGGGDTATPPKPPSVRMSAGCSQLELLQYVRPKGYLTSTGTIGRLFNLGGVYMNPSTFGGWFNGSRLSASVLSVRILHANGTIATYEGYEQVYPFRGSMGLLGIVTALEIQLRKETSGMLMSRRVLDMSSTRAGSLFRQQSYSTSRVEAFLSEICNDHNNGANFHFYSRIDTLSAQVLNYDSNPSFDPSSTQEWYDTAVANANEIGYDDQPEEISNDLLELATGLTAVTESMGKAIQRGSLERLETIHNEQSVIPNDGYSSALTVPNYEQVSYFIKCSTNYCLKESVKLIDVTRTFLKENPYQTNSGSEFADIFLFWRIFSVRENELLLEHLTSPGYYIGVEIETIRIMDRIKYSYYFKLIEDLWHTEFPNGGSYHHGKAYGYGPIVPVGQVDNNEWLPMKEYEYIPFQNDTIIQNMYSNETKTKFLSLMDTYDPTGVFRAGSVLRMLGLTKTKYTIQQYTGDTCYTTNRKIAINNAGCISSCCYQKNNNDNDEDNLDGICVDRQQDATIGSKCSSDCDCPLGWLCQISSSSVFGNNNDPVCIPPESSSNTEQEVVVNDTKQSQDMPSLAPTPLSSSASISALPSDLPSLYLKSETPSL